MRIRVAKYTGILASAFVVSAISSVNVTQPAPALDGLFDSHNYDLVANLDSHGRCLFNREVFPAGSTGPDGSNQPYDVIEDLGDRALNIFRAEVIRNNSDTVAEVYSTQGDTTQNSTVVIQTPSEVHADQRSIQEYASTSAAAADAYGQLQELGVTFKISPTAHGSTDEFCQVESALTEPANLPASDGSVLFRSFDPGIGRIRLQVASWDQRLGSYLTARFGNLVTVEYAPEGSVFELTSRSNGVPAAGGSYYLSEGNICSTGFRLAIGPMVTAAHCNWTSGRSAYSYSGGNYLGSFRSSLYNGASVDAQVLDRSVSYSGSIYVGPGVQYGDSSSRIAANGVYPTYLLTQQDTLIVSGGRTGQGNAGFYGTIGCMTLWQSNGTPYQACQLQKFYTSAGIVMGGDSGGPVGVYDPTNGRIIAAGIVTGVWRWYPDDSGQLFSTTMMAVNYLYGYPGVG